VPEIMPAARISSCAGVDHVAHRRAAEIVPEHAHEPGLSERRVPARMNDVMTQEPQLIDSVRMLAHLQIETKVRTPLGSLSYRTLRHFALVSSGNYEKNYRVAIGHRVSSRTQRRPRIARRRAGAPRDGPSGDSQGKAAKPPSRSHIRRAGNSCDVLGLPRISNP